jgi:hypothetical protein
MQHVRFLDVIEWLAAFIYDNKRRSNQIVDRGRLLFTHLRTTETFLLRVEISSRDDIETIFIDRMISLVHTYGPIKSQRNSFWNQIVTDVYIVE